MSTDTVGGIVLRELPIRITVLHVPPGVTFAIQRGKDELLGPARSKDGSLIFDLSVRVSERKGGGPPSVLGPYAQGKPDDRFIYPAAFKLVVASSPRRPLDRVAAVVD